VAACKLRTPKNILPPWANGSDTLHCTLSSINESSRTVEYYDRVFAEKMNSLVYVSPRACVPMSANSIVYRAGACDRLRKEKGEPVISYEAFVEDLNPSDAFTTSILDVLVKVRPAYIM
jgi:hypothetical protein